MHSDSQKRLRQLYVANIYFSSLGLFVYNIIINILGTFVKYFRCGCNSSVDLWFVDRNTLPSDLIFCSIQCFRIMVSTIEMHII